MYVRDLLFIKDFDGALFWLQLFCSLNFYIILDPWMVCKYICLQKSTRLAKQSVKKLYSNLPFIFLINECIQISWKHTQNMFIQSLYFNFLCNLSLNQGLEWLENFFCQFSFPSPSLSTHNILMHTSFYKKILREYFFSRDQ